MNKLIASAAAVVTLAGVVAVLLSGASEAANRVTTDTEPGAVYLTELRTLPDGGCSVKAYAAIANPDGGVQYEASRIIEVSGANRVSCLDVQTKALVLFKSSNGF